jgi:uncharacterized protein (DUF1800 family)
MGMKRMRNLLITTTVVAALLAPVGAQQSKPSKGSSRPVESRSAVPAAPDDKTIVHVLNRLGFGPGPGDVERVRRIGLTAYIEQQLRPESLPDTAIAGRLASFSTLQMSTQELAEKYYIPAQMERRQRQRAQQGQPGTEPPAGTGRPNRPQAPAVANRPQPQAAMTEQQRGERQAFAELAQQKILRAVYSERQLEEVMVDFWFNHFNVFGGKGPTRMYLTEYERDVIRPHALGRFSDLLQATAKSPAMLFYLDNWQSVAPEGTQTSAARPDAMGPGGRMPRPGQVGGLNGRRRPGMPGMPVPQRPGARQRPGQDPDMQRPQPPAQNRRRDINENYARELMELHTLGVDGGYTQADIREVARAFTGWTIRNPRAGGEFRFEPRMHDNGEKVVLGQKIKPGGGMKDGEAILDLLARHPSTAQFVATKLARRFVADEPPAALVKRAAARFTETNGDIREVVRAIVTSPEFFDATAYRAKVKTPLEFVASATRATGVDLPNAMPAIQALRELGMPPYMCEPPTGYADQAEAWVNTGALLNRMNFALALTGGRDGRGRARQAAAQAPQLSTDNLIKHALAGDVSDTTRSTIAKATTSSQAIALVLGSPEFQRR